MEAYRLHDDELSGQPEPRRIGRPLAGVYERTISDYQFSWMSGTAVKRCGKPSREQHNSGWLDSPITTVDAHKYRADTYISG